MDRIHVRLARPHRHEPAKAQACLERLMAAIGARFPAFNFKWKWEGEARAKATYSFERPEKGSGGGSAELRAGEVDVELTGMYKLPFFVPVRLAEMKVRDELTKALDEAFGEGK